MSGKRWGGRLTWVLVLVAVALVAGLLWSTLDLLSNGIAGPT